MSHEMTSGAMPEPDRAASDRLRDEPATTLAEVAIEMLWNVRGDPKHAPFVAEATQSLGVRLPLEANAVARRDRNLVLSLGPRSWLFAAAPSSPLAPDFDATRSALNAAGAALFDVSSGYVGWSIAGVAAPRVLGRGCPLDLDPLAFPPERCAQSMLGHFRALIYRPGDAPSFVVMVARSYAADALEFLRASAATEGCVVAAPLELTSIGAKA